MINIYSFQGSIEPYLFDSFFHTSFDTIIHDKPPPLRGRWLAEGQTEGVIGRIVTPSVGFADSSPARGELIYIFLRQALTSPENFSRAWAAASSTSCSLRG